jgi:hypothetical protein
VFWLIINISYLFGANAQYLDPIYDQLLYCNMNDAPPRLDHVTPLIYTTLVLIIQAISWGWKYWKLSRALSRIKTRYWIKGSCVRDLSRTDECLINRNSEVEFTNPEWTFGNQECKWLTNESFEACQISPIIQPTIAEYEPTIIHKCVLTQKAAGLRALRSRLEPDPLELCELLEFYTEVMEPYLIEEFIDAAKDNLPD